MHTTCIYKGPSIKDVRRDGGRGVWSNADTCRQGVKDLAYVRKLVLSLLFQHASQTLCRMMPIKVQIVIHLTQFAPQSIVWTGTKAYIQLTLRVRLLIT